MWGLIALAAACTTTPEPSPSPSPSPPTASSPGPSEPVGLRVAVVLPPQGESPLTTTGTRAAAEAVDDHFRDAVGEFRSVAPDPGAFVGDVVTVLAEQGYDLVCVVGSRAAEVVLRVAPTFPATRFCGVPAPGAMDAEAVPANALLVDVRMEEAAYLAGIAAAAAPRPPRPSSTEGTSPAPAGAGFVADGTHPLTPRQRAAFVAGLADGPGAPPATRVDVTPTDDEEVAARAIAQLEAGVPVVFVTAASSDTGVLDAAAANDGVVIVHRDRARFDGDTPEEVLVWFLLDVSVALEEAVERAVGGWEGGITSVGLAEDALRPQAGAAPSSTTTFARVREAAAAVRDGSRTVPGP